jgi:hypothetical protein
VFACVRQPESRRYDYHLAFHTRTARDRIVETITAGWRAQTREAAASTASAEAASSLPAVLESADALLCLPCVTIEDPDLNKYVFDDSLAAKQLKSSLHARYALERQSCVNAIVRPLPPLDATAPMSQHNFDFLQLSSPAAMAGGSVLAARASVSASSSESKQTRRQQQLRKYLNEAGDRNEVYFSDEILKVNSQGLRQVRPRAYR